MTVSKSRSSNQTLEGSRGTSRGLVDTSFAFVTDLKIGNLIQYRFGEILRLHYVDVKVKP